MPIYAGQILRAADLNPTPWQPVTFTAPWHNFGSGWSDVQFRRRPLTGTVELKGTMDGRTSGGDAPSNDSLAFVLPEGYRPLSNLAVVIGHVSTPRNSAIQLRAYTNGEVRIIGANSLQAAVVSLDGVEFDFTQ